MPKYDVFEDRIKAALLEQANEVAASEQLTCKVRQTLFGSQRRENPMKKVFSIKRALIIAAVVCCFAAVAAYAVGTIQKYYSQSSALPTYTAIPSAERLKSDIGFAPKIIADFSNGYSFRQATIAQVSGQDKNGNQVSSFKQLNAEYMSAGGRNMTLVLGGASDSSGTVASSYQGIDLKYLKHAQKFVTADYQMTQEDKKAQQDGSLWFGFGGDNVELVTVQSLQWSDEGIVYMLTTQDTVLSSNDLAAMAQQLIDLK